MTGVIVTGAFGALGSAVVSELAQRGHGVAGVDIGQAPDGAFPGFALGGVDLLDEAAVIGAYESASRALGRIDGLVNVAGGFAWQLVAGGSTDTWDRMYRINLRTCANSCIAALPLLENGGAIVNVGAAGATKPAAGMAAYAASKAGVAALTQSLAEELRDRGVTVNAVLPTIIDTPANRSEMPNADRTHWVRPEAAARVIAFLLSPDARAITGAAIPLSLAG